MSKKKERVAVTAANFKARVGAVVRSGKSIRGNIQELVHYAMMSYLQPESNGSTADLSYLYGQVAGVKSLNHRVLGLYIEDSVNVKLAKTSDGDAVFRKAVKGEAPSLCEGADLSLSWWEHGRTTEPKALDIIKQLGTLMQSLKNTQSADAKRPLAEGQDCVVDEVIAQLKGLETWTANAISVRAAAALAEAGTTVQPGPNADDVNADDIPVAA